MAELATLETGGSQCRRGRRLDAVAWGMVALGLVGAVLNASLVGPTWLQLSALLGHGFVLATGAAMLARPRGTAFAIGLWFVIVLICFPAFPRTLPGRRELAYQVHLIAGVLGLTLGVWASGVLSARSPWRRWGLGVVLAGLLSAPAVASVVRDWRSQSWQPPQYDESAWRFLSATSAEQTNSPHFPSAIRTSQVDKQSCTSAGCHNRNACRIGSDHLDTDPNESYSRLLADFAKRKGAASAEWCAGCHGPHSGTPVERSLKAGLSKVPHFGQLSCGSCHSATQAHGSYGSAALTYAGLSARTDGFQAEWRPRQHKASMLRPLHRTAEFCGACHRKNWSLPQNEYRFVPGQDEFQQWSESRYAGGALLAPGEATTSKSCLSCHGNDALKAAKPTLELDAFLRGVGPSTFPPQPVDAATIVSGKRYYLDVVVHNAGIGHDFPTGMVDQRESWLEVTLQNQKGKSLLASGSGDARHLYRLVGLDRDGKAIVHGDLDRMVRTSEWRRIPAGGSDVARYEFTANTAVQTLGLRLVRRIRPEFARWTGQPSGNVEVLAETEFGMGVGSESKSKSKNGNGIADEKRWRRYAEALAAVKAYPFAVQAMQRSLSFRPRDVESLIGLGRIFLAEGDLLSAQDQLRLARDAAAGDPFQSARVAAWLASATRTAQPAQAVAILNPLVERYPKDPRLRFELGRGLMDLLRNREAAAQFKALLDADPLNATAHYNLMLCYQRLNLLSEARREEVIYRLMAPDSESSLGTESVPTQAREARPLHVHQLEAPR